MKTNFLRRNRSLQIESLEHREMLSVNPLGIDNNAPAVYAAAAPAPIAAAAEAPDAGGTITTAQAIAIGERVDGYLDSADVDIYKVTVTAGQKLAFRANPHLDGVDWETYLMRWYVDTEMRLFDSTGTKLDVDYDDYDGYGVDLMKYTFATAGTYYIGVADSNNQEYLLTTNSISGTVASGYTGVYTFSVFVLPTVKYTADNVTISFTGKANTKYSLLVEVDNIDLPDEYTTTTDADGAGTFDIPRDGEWHFYQIFEGELEKIPAVDDDYWGYYYEEWDYVDKADHSRVAYCNMFALWWGEGVDLLSTATPTGLATGAVTSTSVKLFWTAVSGADIP